MTAVLIGYVVPGSPPPSSRDLVDYLRARLPDAGVPTGWVFLDALPLSSNGKVDRQALASATGKRPALDAPFAPPETPVEELIAQIWSEVLRIDRVGRHDHFFELGGSSLAALRVGARLGERVAGTAGLCPGRARSHPADRRYFRAQRRPGRRRRAPAASRRTPEGAGRTHHAGGPRAQ